MRVDPVYKRILCVGNLDQPGFIFFRGHQMRVHRMFRSAVLAALFSTSLAACSSGGGGDSAPVAPTITTGFLSQVEVNVPLSQSLAATGTGPLTWQITNGSLPTGITLESSGALTGTPTANQEGQYPFTVRVTGPGGTATKDLKLVILGSTHRVSVVSSTSPTDPLGEANGPSGDHARSFDPGISNTGRFVVFDSAASNLVPNLNPGGARQVYLHDRQTGITEMVSVSSAGAPGNGDSFVAAVSDDGNIVVFDSFASNFAANDTGDVRDVFLRNRAVGATQRISQQINGNQGDCPLINTDPLLCNSSDPSISADGSIVAFASLSRLTPDDTDDFNDIFVFNRSIPSLQRVSVGVGGASPNAPSGSPAVSANGRYVTFASDANNLVAGDVVDPVSDIFVFDRQTGQLRKASVVPGGAASNGGSFGPSISGDGRFVAFWSESDNLLPDANGSTSDIFVADMQLNPGDPNFLKLLVNGNFQQGDGNSRAPSISRDGKIVAFDSEATNIDVTTPDNNGIRDIYVIDRSCSSTFNLPPCTYKRASVASNGAESNGESRFPALSGDGKYVTYYSDANNLVPFIGDNFGFRDAFVTKR